MAEENEKNESPNNALINITITDLLGLKAAYPALTKSIDRFIKAIEKGTGHLISAPRDVTWHLILRL